jgi:hypothetical protein
MTLHVMADGAQFSVFDDEGAKLAGPYAKKWWAEKRRNDLAGVVRPPKSGTRPCLCCRDPFLSTGAHHRMCDYCRSQNSGLDRQMVG